jgi:hypothetical protein
MNFIEKPKETFNKVRFLDYYMEGHSGFIAGGCFKNIFKKERVKDLDIFFENENEFNKANEFFKSDENYIFSYENHKVISYKNKNTNIRIELIRHTYGTPKEIISMFDFSITRFAYAKKQENNEIVYYNVFVDTFFEDLTNSKLVIDGDLLFPISSFERSYRYRTYGFGLCKESKAKLIEALKNSNTDDLSNDLYFGID